MTKAFLQRDPPRRKHQISIDLRAEMHTPLRSGEDRHVGQMWYARQGGGGGV